MTVKDITLYFSPSLSQIGVSCLQWPHLHSAGVQVCRCAGEQACRRAGVQACKCAIPGGVELDQDVLSGVQSDRLEVLADEDLDRLLVPVLGDVCRHEVGLDLARQVLGHERPDVGVAQLRGVGLELGHVLLELDDPHARQLGLLHAEELHDPLVILLVGVDGDEEHLALVVLGDAAQDSNLKTGKSFRV